MKKSTLTIAILMCVTFESAFANNDHRGNENWNAIQPVPHIQGQAQGQLQGQLQGQKSYNKNSLSSTNRNNLSTTSTTSNSTIANPVASAAGGISGVDFGNGIQVTGGETAGSNLSSGSNVTTTVYEQVKQVPMAWSPNMAMSMSPENCSNSASLGAAAGFGAISGGLPMDSEACNRRMDTRMWVALGQMRIACERMKQDEDNANAMKNAGFTCANVVNIVPTPTTVMQPKQSTLPPDDYWTKAAATRDAQLRAMQGK